MDSVNSDHERNQPDDSESPERTARYQRQTIANTVHRIVKEPDFAWAAVGDFLDDCPHFAVCGSAILGFRGIAPQIWAAPGLESNMRSSTCSPLTCLLPRRANENARADETTLGSEEC